MWHGAQARGGGAGRVLIWCVAQQRLTAVVNKRARASLLLPYGNSRRRGTRLLLCTHGMKRSIPPIPQSNWIDPVDSDHQLINRPGSGRGTCAAPSLQQCPWVACAWVLKHRSKPLASWASKGECHGRMSIRHPSPQATTPLTEPHAIHLHLPIYTERDAAIATAGAGGAAAAAGGGGVLLLVVAADCGGAAGRGGRAVRVSTGAFGGCMMYVINADWREQLVCCRHGSHVDQPLPNHTDSALHQRRARLPLHPGAHGPERRRRRVRTTARVLVHCHYRSLNSNVGHRDVVAFAFVRGPGSRRTQEDPSQISINHHHHTDIHQSPPKNIQRLGQRLLPHGRRARVRDPAAGRVERVHGGRRGRLPGRGQWL